MLPLGNAVAAPPQQGRNATAGALPAGSSEQQFSRLRSLPLGDEHAPVLTG
jgi:hypothetical protein